MAILYQAYRQANGTWPNSEVSRQLIMNSATDLGYDVHRQGAGRVHAGRAAALAARAGGVEVTPSLWDPGDFRDQELSGYASVVYPGDQWIKEFKISNVGPAHVSLDVQDVRLEEFDHVDFAIETIATRL